MGTDERMLEKNAGPMISINPMTFHGISDEAKKQFLDLQLRMVTSSINHEYARMELGDDDDFDRCEQLLDYMNDCRKQYFEARSELEAFDAYALADFEAELIRQKQAMLTEYQA